MVQKRSFLPFLAQKAVFGNFFEVLCDARTIYANKEESSEYLKKTSSYLEYLIHLFLRIPYKDFFEVLYNDITL